MLFREEDEDLELFPFRDRAEAGRLLAGKLSGYLGRKDVIVLAIPRGGVPATVLMPQSSSSISLPKPIVWIFPMNVCLDCGESRFTVPERKVGLLVGGAAVEDPVVLDEG